MYALLPLLIFTTPPDKESIALNRKLFLLALFIMSLAVYAGCDMGTYDARFQQQLQLQGGGTVVADEEPQE